MALDDNTGAGFRFYSLGIVTRDKEEGSDWIDVTPIEDFPMELGDLSESDRLRVSTMPNSSNVKKTARVQGGSVVRAKWVPLSNPNRDNAPDVYRTETVMLYKYADTQDYYWSTVFREPRLRGRERVRISLSNKDAGGKPYDSETSYWLEVDTKYKLLQIHTSSNDGEPTSYDITLNTKEGIFSLVDELGNFIRLESVAGHLNVTTENSIEVNTKRYKINASESIEFNTPKYTLNADEATINGNNLNINSFMTATEGFHLSGGQGSTTGTFVGDFKVIGNIQAEGNIDASGTIMDGAGNSNHHSH